MLGVSQWGYYAWKEGPPSQRTLRHAWLAGEIAQVHKDSGATYGALRVTGELRYGRGIHVGHNQVELLMRRLGLHGLRNAVFRAARRSARRAPLNSSAGAYRLNGDPDSPRRPINTRWRPNGPSR